MVLPTENVHYTENYEKAKEVLVPLASAVEREGIYSKPLRMSMEGFEVALHGSFCSGLSRRMDKVQQRVESLAEVRIWDNDGTDIPLPSADADAFLIFTHILELFYNGVVGISQICDWCRLLLTFKDNIDRNRLRSRLREAGIMQEWIVFCTYAVDYLGAPEEVMPFYRSRPLLHSRAGLLHRFILKEGNFWHNRDMNYFGKHPCPVRKRIPSGQRFADFLSRARIFPLNSCVFSLNTFLHGSQSVIAGK